MRKNANAPPRKKKKKKTRAFGPSVYGCKCCKKGERLHRYNLSIASFRKMHKKEVEAKKERKNKMKKKKKKKRPKRKASKRVQEILEEYKKRESLDSSFVPSNRSASFVGDMEPTWIIVEDPREETSSSNAIIDIPYSSEISSIDQSDSI